MQIILKVATWVLSSGGAGVIAFWLIDQFRWPKAFPSRYKRYLAFVLTGAVAVAVWAFVTWVSREPFPQAPQDWAVQVVAVVGAAIVSSQVTHAEKTLKARDRAVADAMRGDDIPEM